MGRGNVTARIPNSGFEGANVDSFGHISGNRQMRGLTTGLALSDRQSEMIDNLKRYLDKHFPSEHEGPSSSFTPEWFDDDEFEWHRAFNRKLAEDGWLVSHWPE